MSTVHQSLPKKKSWYFPVAGASRENNEVWSYQSGERLEIIVRNVKPQPPLVLLDYIVSTDKNKLLFASVGKIEFEVEIRDHDFKDNTFELIGPYSFFNLLALKTGYAFQTNVISNASFADLSLLEKRSVELEPYPSPILGYRMRDFRFLHEDFVWITSNLDKLAEMFKLARFGLAFEAFWTVSQQSHQGAALLMAWAGIEAFFSVDSELSFRLALLLSTYLGQNAQARREL